MSYSVAVIGDGVVVKESGIPGAGNGLWAARQFSRNDLITEYQGKLIDHEKAVKLRARGQHTHVRVLNSMHLYIDGLKQPEPGRGGASFANDARDPDITNAMFIQKFDAKLGRDRVFLKALKDIDCDKEIFVSYGKTYWQNSKCDAQTLQAQRAPLQQLQQVSNPKCRKNRHKQMLTGTTLLQLLTESQHFSQQSSQQSSATVQQTVENDGNDAALEPSRCESSLTFLYVAAEACQARAKLHELGQQRRAQQLQPEQQFHHSSYSQGLAVHQVQPRRSSRVSRTGEQQATAAAAAAAAIADPLENGWGVRRPRDCSQHYRGRQVGAEGDSAQLDSVRTSGSVGLMDALFDVYSKVTNCVSQIV